MLTSRLSHPDFPEEHGDHAHAPSVEAALRAAYPFLLRQRFQQAQSCLTPVRHMPMSAGQRLRVLYIDALAARESGHLDLSTVLLDQALSLAVALNARCDYSLLGSELAKAYYYCQQYPLAAHAAKLGLDAEDAAPHPDVAVRLSREVELRHRRGVCLLHLNEFAAADLNLFMAYHLADRLPAHPAHALKKAKVCWDLALLYHLSGNITLARYYAELAHPLLDTFDSPASCARLEITHAGFLLDHAAPLGLPDPLAHRRDLLREAERLLICARLRLFGSPDRFGDALLTLAHTRLTRLQGRQDDHRVGRIESVLHLAEETDSLMLYGKCYAALALEFLAMEEHNQGINCLRLAVEAFDASQGPAEGLMALRTLYFAEEMRDD
jgi:hypothetical protein